MIKPVGLRQALKGSVKIAVLTVVFAASGTGVALAGTTSGNGSILGGNQISVPVSVPVSVCGNALAVVGEALGLCEAGAQVSLGGGSGSSTSGNGSAGGGNQVSIPISVPVNICGNGIAALGRAAASCKGGPDPRPGRHHRTPPPACHHHRRPQKGHKHGGAGTAVTSSTLPPANAITASDSLPTTGANLTGLLALGAGATICGAGCVLFLARRGLAHSLPGSTRRAARALQN